MTFEEKLLDLITNHMFALESQNEVQRQTVYIELAAAKATLQCVSDIGKAIQDNF